MKLEKSQIIDEAISLIDEVGLDAFNLRELAGRLSVRVSALYWHFKDKSELLDRISATLNTRAREAISGNLSWDQWLTAFGHSLRSTLLAHRDSAKLCSNAAPAFDKPEESIAVMAAPMLKAGLTTERVVSFQAAVLSLTVGLTQVEQSEKLHDYVSHIIDFDATYNDSLTAMVTGFKMQVARKA